jgi:hypothetical protein
MENRDEYKKRTITLFFKSLRGYRRNTRPVKISNENAAWTNEANYLGLSLDSDNILDTSPPPGKKR